MKVEAHACLFQRLLSAAANGIVVVKRQYQELIGYIHRSMFLTKILRKDRVVWKERWRWVLMNFCS